ncbi:hypothetical protein M409DRAFT_69866 [Zasmidium cellare ATCC 36951]|uniref:SAM-dependent MTase RsmB/NOP-type domain-containing protein n=1 Tax=Zasmidium cellare ATCC 36951 TaxID=1080233 RepID=A0A6A6C2A7_ZASCE|nr:uncharacterized protein M409DRAFT_69866 [Zasmidium cellare ATCC 36951]KAF2161247.1 hypothetical protein M409DRAFT_69866 [Zasmidium cellare ATCC 36951]
MSLYHEAADILERAQKNGGSLKSIVFGKKTWKTDGKTLFALTSEAAKWSEILSEVVERSGVLGVEKSLTPTLALLLTHDLFLSKKGVALPSSHGLNTSISRHKVRLSAELTKARLRRGFATLDALRAHVNSEAANGPPTDPDSKPRIRHPRWIRINTLRTSFDDELAASFTTYTQAQSLKEITHATPDQRLYHVDEHIPNLIAITGPDDPTTFKSYKQGKLILQEKASCFPAYLLDPRPGEGDVIDACAAPGNKTTHVASLLTDSQSKVTACEKDPERSKTLEKMVKLAGAGDVVTVKQKQNFLKLDPAAKECRNVTSLLLDPSCSGNGIFGRDEATVTVRLPSATTTVPASKGKKRKRGGQKTQPAPEPTDQDGDAITEETPEQDDEDEAKLKARLENLSTFQLRLLQHAMSFPAAKRITYSTCSIHAEENENVVVQALLSDVAHSRGWRIMKRADQVDGMRRWHKRGSVDAARQAIAASTTEGGAKDFDAAEVADSCIRCEKGGEDGTMGFFVAGFVRDGDVEIEPNGGRNGAVEEADGAADDDDEEWNGFSGDEA